MSYNPLKISRVSTCVWTITQYYHFVHGTHIINWPKWLSNVMFPMNIIWESGGTPLTTELRVRLTPSTPNSMVMFFDMWHCPKEWTNLCWTCLSPTFVLHMRIKLYNGSTHLLPILWYLHYRVPLRVYTNFHVVGGDLGTKWGYWCTHYHTHLITFLLHTYS
jgi:hypothetical protein